MHQFAVPLCLAVVAGCALAAPFPGCKGGTLEGCPGTANCSKFYLDTQIDHFNWVGPTRRSTDCVIHD